MVLKVFVHCVSLLCYWAFKPFLVVLEIWEAFPISLPAFESSLSRSSIECLQKRSTAAVTSFFKIQLFISKRVPTSSLFLS